jgi:hypothetical protein
MFQAFIVVVLLFIAFTIFVVVIIRWLLRINVIVDLLQENNLLLRNIAQIKCDVCGKNCPADKMLTIDSGQNLCQECIKKFQ